MRIAYLLESADLCGGVRVVLDQARALRSRGHEVRVFIRRGQPTWYPYAIAWQTASQLTEAAESFRAEIVIATFWTTIADACRIRAALPIHLCQGIELDFVEYARMRAAIEAAYRCIRHKFVIGPWLQDRLEALFGTAAFEIACIGQGIDTLMYRPGRHIDDCKTYCSPRPRILIPGLNTPVKGVATALAAIHHLRASGMRCRVVRVSPAPIDRLAEQLGEDDECHVGVEPSAMADLYRSARVVVTPSAPAEGFGLPFAEALACRRPVVATAIPSYLSLCQRHDYAFFAPPGDVPAMAKMIKAALRQPLRAWAQARRGARLVQEHFAIEKVAERIERASLLWRDRGGLRR
ncbi:MAG: glycosyltransferase family 4 protein [Rhodocyclaceae bacterium]|nr:glycosyltransferase family 4 protein [Rhodocyclaceae bacterium]